METSRGRRRRRRCTRDASALILSRGRAWQRTRSLLHPSPAGRVSVVSRVNTKKVNVATQPGSGLFMQRDAGCLWNNGGRWITAALFPAASLVFRSSRRDAGSPFRRTSDTRLGSAPVALRSKKLLHQLSSPCSPTVSSERSI